MATPEAGGSVAKWGRIPLASSRNATTTAIKAPATPKSNAHIKSHPVQPLDDTSKDASPEISQPSGGCDRLMTEVDSMCEIESFPFKGYDNQPDLSLRESMKHIPGDDIVQYIQHAMDATHGIVPQRKNPSNLQYRQEIAAVHLYTQEKPKIYSTLNRLLRTGVAKDLKPWLPYFRLLMRGMESLQVPRSQTVFRGVRRHLLHEYPKGRVFRWDTFTSTTNDADVLTQPEYLGRAGNRTLFILTTLTGAEIKHVSKFKKESEVLIRPGTVFEVTGVISCDSTGKEVVIASEIASFGTGSSILKNEVYDRPEYRNVRILDFEPGSCMELHTIFTNLVTVEGSHLAAANASKSEAALYQHRDSINAINKTPVKVTDLFDPSPADTPSKAIQRLVVYGRAGIGKTTFSSKLLQEWRCGSMLKTFSWVLRIRLRNTELQEHQNEGLAELVHRFCFQKSMHITSSAIHHLLCTRGKHILLILDGYDEYQNNVPALTSLIERQRAGEYPDLCLLITSRPSALYTLTKQHEDPLFDREVEIVGFGANEANQFIEQYFRATHSDAAKGLITYLRANPMLQGLTRIPVLAAMICVIWKEGCNGHLDQIRTVTSLYHQLEKDLEERMKSKWRRQHDKELGASSLSQAMTIVGRIAWEGLQAKPQPKLMFGETTINEALTDVTGSEEVQFCVLKGGWLTRKSYMTSEGRSSLQYSFLHLTMQEYAAAYYIASLSNPKDHLQSLLLDKEAISIMHMPLQFISGLLRKDARGIIQQLCEASRDEHCMQVLILQCCVETETEDIRKELIPKILCDGGLDLHGYSVSSAEVNGLCSVLATKVVHLVCLSLSGCDVTDEGAAALGNALMTNETLQDLNLNDNAVGDGGAKAIGDALANNNSLRRLVLSYNVISEEGGIALGNGLAKNNVLRQLDLRRNRISDPGATAFGRNLAVNKTLKLLHLFDNSISDIGAVALAGGVSQNQALEELYLYSNNITDVGAAELGKAIKMNTSLYVLGLSDNSIALTVQGTLSHPLCTALEANTTLRELYLSTNEIADTGAAQLLKAVLSSSSSLERIYLCNNKITDDGAITIIESLASINIESLTLKCIYLGRNTIRDGRLRETLVRTKKVDI